jgi:hypothetical protein
VKLDYRIGRNIVRTFFDYYAYVGVIPALPKEVLKHATHSTKKRKKKRKNPTKATFLRIKNSAFQQRQRLRRLRRKLTTMKEVIPTKYEPVCSLQKNFIDFSDIKLPPNIERKHTIKHKLLINDRKQKRNVCVKDPLRELNSGLTILTIGE